MLEWQVDQLMMHSCCACRLLRLFACALNLDPDFFNDKFERPIVSLRPLHYSAQVSQPEAGIFGAGPTNFCSPIQREVLISY